MNKIFTKLIEKRGFNSDFLHPKYENLAAPSTLPGVDKAVARIQKAIENHDKIIIYGDYDADGVTASALMEHALLLSGVKPENLAIMLPDRFADGYGMSPRLIKEAEKQGTKLVITVDCGSRNHAIIDELNTLQIDTIVTDHHETDDQMPAALAALNPKRKDSPTPALENLAGVGVAFKLAQALVEAKLIPAGQEKWLLDLVLIGTICDSMLLTGENRILCYYGLKVLAKTRRPGLIELMRRAGVKTISSDAIGFQIGPRINAAGRLDTADISLNLLRTYSPTKAATLAIQLEDLNKKRRTEQNLAIREIKERGLQPGPVIIETGKWHEGIVGIVAGRLVEDFAKPAFVFTETENGIFKGSGRSFGDFDLAKALSHVKDIIIGGGGHASAAGVRVDRKDLYAFREKIHAYYDSLNLKDQTKYLKKSPDLTLDDFSDLTLDLLDELATLEPYGPGNEEPIFRLRNVKISKVTRMGSDQNHLRLDLTDKNSKPFKLVAFFAPEKWLSLTPDAEIEPLITLVRNEFQGITSIEARLLDIDFPH
ncbi:single-stranded-DNA-specific exonuclease RecJ [Candidatus Saccharibacteria bacterium]|nr:single-stranded-DNA-specific exonuclease RecJ [Candidatus Saccharibacteria bacterium]MBR3249060.1 single-stranded-DNA-specific exonuclease RecJ [Candidatus Saccharibacteria bacterium]